MSSPQLCGIVCSCMFVSSSVSCCCLPCFVYMHGWTERVISCERQHFPSRCHSLKGCNQSLGPSLLSISVMEGRPATSPGILLTGSSHSLKMWFICTAHVISQLFFPVNANNIQLPVSLGQNQLENYNFTYFHVNKVQLDHVILKRLTLLDLIDITITTNTNSYHCYLLLRTFPKN